MDDLISVITPVGPGALQHLGEAGRSVMTQPLPRGWRVEWLVQHDGGTVKEARAVLPGDPRISVGCNRRSGPGTARNMALARAQGSLVKVLDADDQLAEDVLARDITALTEQPDVGWSTSRVLDLLPTGATAGFPGDPPAGHVARGDVLRYWRAHDFRASVHPATLCVRRDLLEMLGGWMALPASEDTGLLLALNAVAGGWFSPEVGLLYRKWDGQLTAHAGHVDPTERQARMALIERRATLLLDAPNSISA